jgi:cAMP-dependent protein kinase regulator
VKDAAANKRVKFETFLSSVKILQSMDPYERSQISDALISQVYLKGDTIIRQGDIGDKFFIISDGEASAFKRPDEESKTQELVYKYKKGEYFGERALLTNEARACSIVVTVSLFQRFILMFSLIN